jgi:hypothetical protein
MAETRTRVASKAGRNRSRSFGFEAMEQRTLMSTVASPPVAHPSRAEVAVARKEHRLEVIDAARQKHQAQVKADYHAALNSKATFGKQVAFGYNTVRTAHKLVWSPDIPQAAWSFAKLSISHDTRKIGAAYLKAFFKGDGHTLDQLANTKVVKNIGQEYTNLAHSPVVKKISRGFTHFGDAVATQFRHLFKF